MRDEDLTAARAEAFGSLFVLVQHLSRRADTELTPLGLTTRQWLLLAVLTTGGAGASPSLSQAAATYGSSRQNVKQVALGLQARGFVRLVPDPDDGRTTRLVLTERVREFDQPELSRRTERMLEDVFAGVTPAQTRDLRDLLRGWIATLATTDDTAEPAPRVQVGRAGPS